MQASDKLGSKLPILRVGVLSNGITELFWGTNLDQLPVQPCINQKGPYTGDVRNGARTFIMRLDLLPVAVERKFPP